MAILGLMSSSDLDSYKSETARRRVFYQYPNGSAPLMGLLSLMDTEETDHEIMGWWEERWTMPKDTTAQANAAGPFTDTAGADLTAAGWSQSAGDSIRIYVNDASIFLIRDVVWVKDAAGTASSIKQVRGVVTAVNTTDDYLTVRLTEAVANALNTVANNSLNIFVVSIVAPEGDRSRDGQYSFPIEINNYTQIFRTAFSFTRTALKKGLRFDREGAYKDRAKKMGLRHMTAMEHTAFFGRKGSSTQTNMDSESVPERLTGGVYWFLEQWEKGNTGNGGAFDYRPGGADISASDWDASEDKRIYKFDGATITADEADQLLLQIFKVTSDTTFEKLLLCDSGLIAKFNRFFERMSIKVTQLHSKEDSYGMSITMWETPYGVLYMKTHPLFNQNPAMRNSGFVLDLGNIKWRPLADSDTELLKNRQLPDADKRKDEWLGEGGFEVRFPETHAYIENLGGITV